MIMTLIYPNIVPENDLRLPDALTVKHGPARLLSRFVLEGDKAARGMGLRLRLRHDFGELLYLNEREVAHGNWFKLVNMYNPAYCELSPENSYWISGENEEGDIVLTQAGRIYYWPETSLSEQAHSMFYAGHDEGQLCTVTAPAAGRIGGVVFSAGYGYKHASHSIFYPASPWGDLEVVLAYLSQNEAYEDIAEYLTTGISGSMTDGLSTASARRLRDDKVTSTSSEGVFHGSSSLS